MGPRLRFALLGSPVAHSVSPALYAAAFEAIGVDAEYVLRAVSSAELPTAMRELAVAGGGNVTLPHKEAAAALLDLPTAEVTGSGACNCFWGEGEQLAGDNTDVGGFLAAVEEGPPGTVRGASVLLLGAGGAARAVLLACALGGAARVEVWNRTGRRARELARAFEDRLPRVRVIDRVEMSAGRWDLAVNATRLGLKDGDPLPPEPGEGSVVAALDLVYRRGETAWVRRLREAGIPARDGRGMLVHQAALSVERWLDRSPPLAPLREAAERALGTQTPS